MKFTLEQINAIHDQLGNSETLKLYAQALGDLGVAHADSYVTDGHTDFFDANGHSISSPPTHEILPIADTSDKQEFLHQLDLHESGKTSYLEMSKGLAESGIEKWIIDTQKLTMTFYDKAGNELQIDTL